MGFLEVIAQALESAGIPYEFGQWASAIQYPYWVGEYIESPTATEDGRFAADFILTGTTKGTWVGLEAHKEAIRAAFPPVSGLIKTGDGATVAIHYGSAQNIPTDVADVKRMEVHLEVQEWRA